MLPGDHAEEPWCEVPRRVQSKAAVEAEADSDCEHRQPDVQWHQLLCHLMMIMIMMALMMMMMSMLMATVLAMAMAMAMMETCIFLRSVIAQTQRTRSPVARNWSPIPP